MPKLLSVHPINEDLRFLSKLVKRISADTSLESKHLRLSNNFKTHAIAKVSISAMQEDDLLLILCHGRPNGILGCSFKAEVGSHGSRYVYEESNGLFISQNDFPLLIGKKVICVACQSAIFGKKAVTAGVSVFIGFNKIDFDIPVEGKKPNSNVAPKVKYILRCAIYWAITYARSNNLNFEQLGMLMKIYLNRHADILYKQGKNRSDINRREHIKLRKAKSFKYYLNAAERILEISSGIEVLGDKYLKV